MCKFCDKIYTRNDLENTNNWDLPSIFVYQERNGRIHLYTTCPDSYYDGVTLYDIRYCPVCGRDLTLND